MRLLALGLVLLVTGCMYLEPAPDTPSTDSTTPESQPVIVADKTTPPTVTTTSEETIPTPIPPSEPDVSEANEPGSDSFEHHLAETLCVEIGDKLASVTTQDCLRQQLTHSTTTQLVRSLAFRDFHPDSTSEHTSRVLVIGGIHGDEYSSVSVLFKWMDLLDNHARQGLHWRFIPVANPDGLLKSKSQRQNHSGVDLNRNFPTTDWNELAIRYWKDSTHSNPRRDPGPYRASEIETRWLVNQIREFQPDYIVSLHAPYHLVDYDGPKEPPPYLGSLHLKPLGVYPGSLGNYAGVDLKLPVITVELKSAGIMPPPHEIHSMLTDLVEWLHERSHNEDVARAEQ